MIKDGEKFACETCIRGHRVAQCQHTDRPLQQVSGKGRPVSQCGHCRTLRQSHSVHTRCNSPLTKFTHVQSRAVAATAKLASVPTRKKQPGSSSKSTESLPTPLGTIPSPVSTTPSQGATSDPLPSCCSTQPHVALNSTTDSSISANSIGGLDDWSPDTFLDSLGATSDGSLMSHSPGWMSNLTPLPDMNLDQSSVENIIPMLDYSLQGIDSTSLADDINKLPDLNLYGNMDTANFDWNPSQLMTANDSNQARLPTILDPNESSGSTEHDVIWPTTAGVTPADESTESVTKPMGFDIDSSVFSPEEFLLFYGEPH
ncbi:hypothetical protein NM208_g8341 [Fusarium decemcellulare]|uniref:Uncharacterized protein n=1 Tax=Fusarium decemcellulare TaxID=57161 RepID=A0ACC1S5Y6_9HYPO|nr:hypothetical protein NM208_g8341 [Fusarium decemcellulare]